MKKRVIIVHGWEGHPEDGWYPWLKKELEQRDFEVITPQLPDPETPRISKWVHALSQVVKILDERTYFVGHSLGCITILRFLETSRDKQKVGGAILVAGFGHDLEYKGYNRELSSFFEKPIDWKKIRTKAKRFVVIHSGDDEWVPAKHNKIYQEKLGAEGIILNGYKHFSGDDGVYELPIVLEKLLEISNERK